MAATQTITGAERAAVRLTAKAEANAKFYANTPVQPISRQVRRRREMEAFKRLPRRA